MQAVEQEKNHLPIGARISQQIAKRAFSATEEYKKRKRGKPRFKGRRGLSSIEDNHIDANLRLKENTIHLLCAMFPKLGRGHCSFGALERCKWIGNLMDLFVGSYQHPFHEGF